VSNHGVESGLLVKISLVLIAAMISAQAAIAQPSEANRGVAPPGLKEIQVPFASLKPDATFKIGVDADWVQITEDAVWVASSEPAAVHRIDPKTKERVPIDLGFVGEPERVDAEVLRMILNSDLIPVVAPIGVGSKGETYNINADTVAGAVAGAIAAERLVLLTDVEGVLDSDGKVIPHLTVSQARALMADGTISGGMIPKIETAVDAVEKGVRAAVILDGRIPHVLLLELFTEHGAGTLITAE